MLFGRSIFQSVLERLAGESEAGESEAETLRTHRISGLTAGFVAERVAPGASGPAARQALYQEFAAEAPRAAEPPAAEPEPEPPMPPYLTRLAAAEVLEDLALSPADTLASLSERRRLFARLNHPDSVPACFREQATARMKIANLLIDEAIGRLPGRAPQRYSRSSSTQS